MRLTLGALQGIRNILEYQEKGHHKTRILPRKSGNREQVEFGSSTCIRSKEYLPTNEALALGDLIITFVGPPGGGQGTFVYHDVPLEEYTNLMQAGSEGTYFNLYIRDIYSNERIA